VTQFSRFRSQPSGNTAMAVSTSTLRLSAVHSDCHVTMRIG